MQHFLSRKYSNALLLAALIIILSCDFFTYKQIHKMLQTNNWVIHTYEVINKLNQALISTLNAEIKIRSYLILKDKQNAEGVVGDLTNTKSTLHYVRELTSDNPVQQKQLDKLEPLESKQETTLASITALSLDNLSLSNTINSIAEVHEQGSQIRECIYSMENEEASLLVKRNLQFNKDVQRSTLTILTGSSIGLVMLLLGFYLISLQIEHRSRAEQKGLELENRFKKIIDGSRDFIVALDSHFRIMAFNQAYQRKFQSLFGKKIEIGMDLSKTLDETQENKQMLEAWQRALQGEEFTTVLKFGRKEGEEQIYEISFSAIRGVDNQLIGASHIMRDVTVRAKVEKLKDDFISVVSHELRTPLTSIRGALGLILGRNEAGSLDEKNLKLLTIASNNCERLIHLINDILDVDKIQADKIELHLEKVDINKIAESAVYGYLDKPDRKDVKVVLKKESQALFVNADYDRMVQVLENLISNAVKFSKEKGVVNIEVSQHENQARVSVTDHGKGVAEEYKESIFQKFQQADSSSSRKVGGTGLGLLISKAIVDKHFGKIDFISEPNKITVFYVDLPLADNPHTS